MHSALRWEARRTSPALWSRIRGVLPFSDSYIVQWRPFHSRTGNKEDDPVVSIPLQCSTDLLPRDASYYFPKESGKCDGALQDEEPIDPKVIRGACQVFTLDVGKPLLRQEEMMHWRLDKMVFASTVHFAPDAAPIFLLPRDAEVPSLGPDMDRIDHLYRRKGLLAPSEVAQVFMKITPTYYVETRHVFHALNPDVSLQLERLYSRAAWVNILFGKYPMLFMLRRPKYHKSAVKLNTDFWFVRSHPDFRKGDRLHYRHNAEYSANVGGVVHKHAPGAEAVSEDASRRPVDLRIFDILVEHLPRSANVEKQLPLTATPSDDTPPRGDKSAIRMADVMATLYQPVPLVSWINSFTRKELEELNTVPPERVLLILQRYCRVFQLVCMRQEDANVFTDCRALGATGSSELVYSAADPNVAHSRESSDRDDAGESAESNQGGILEDVQHCTGKEEPGGASDDAGATQRAQMLAGALRDELIGLEDLQPGDVNEITANVECADLCSDPLNLPEEDDEEQQNTHCTPGTQSDDGGQDCHTGPQLDTLYIRRLPPHIAPRSLSNYNQHNTPDRELLQHAASFLNPPPSLEDDYRNYFTASANACGRPAAALAVPTSATETVRPWRWVPIDTIYQSLDKERQLYLRRRYKGLANFLRLHGEVFELSDDYTFVIAHDPKGIIAPIPPTQKRFFFEERVVLSGKFDADPSLSATLIGEETRRNFQRILGSSQIPTNRQQLTLLDPHNPLMHHEVLIQEIAACLPNYPVTKQQLLGHLPPILRAAIPPKFSIGSAHKDYLTTWTERGVMMVQRKELSQPSVLQEKEITLVEAIDGLRSGVPEGGATIRALMRMHLSQPVINALSRHYGNVYKASRAYPQYFTVQDSPTGAPSDALVKAI